jgi:hypothetical protein
MKTIGPRSLAGGLKVICYIAFGLGILYFFFQMLGFTMIFKHADDLSNYGYLASSIYQLPAEHFAQKEWRSENGQLRFTLHRVYGELRHRNLPRPFLLFLLFCELFMFFCYFLAIIQLANFFEDLSQGKVFTVDSARHLRLVGLSVAGAALFNPIFEILPAWLSRDALTPQGAKIPWLMFLWLKANNLSLLLAGLLLVVVAEAFRIGHKLDEEQQLTV